jgi:hypothetical protein
MKHVFVCLNTSTHALIRDGGKKLPFYWRFRDARAAAKDYKYAYVLKMRLEDLLMKLAEILPPLPPTEPETK